MKLVILLLASLFLVGCGTVPTGNGDTPAPRPGTYQAMDDGTGALSCTDKSVAMIDTTCYTLEALDNFCRGGGNYFENTCDVFGFGQH